MGKGTPRTGTPGLRRIALWGDFKPPSFDPGRGDPCPRDPSDGFFAAPRDPRGDAGPGCIKGYGPEARTPRGSPGTIRRQRNAAGYVPPTTVSPGEMVLPEELPAVQSGAPGAGIPSARGTFPRFPGVRFRRASDDGGPAQGVSTSPGLAGSGRWVGPRKSPKRYVVRTPWTWMRAHCPMGASCGRTTGR